MDDSVWKAMALARKQTLGDQSKPPEERIQAYLTEFCIADSFDGVNGVQHCQVVKADAPNKTIEPEVTITPRLCNRLGIFHGGAAATFLDDLTSLCLTYFKSLENDWTSAHVSRTITMSYLRPVKSGQTVRVRCVPVAVGKKAANLYGEVRGMDGQVCGTCIHDKAILSPPASIAAQL